MSIALDGKSIVRRVWVFNGQRPTVVVQYQDLLLYLYAFVHPAEPTHPVVPPTNCQYRPLSLGLEARGLKS